MHTHNTTVYISELPIGFAVFVANQEQIEEVMSLYLKAYYTEVFTVTHPDHAWLHSSVKQRLKDEIFLFMAA